MTLSAPKMSDGIRRVQGCLFTLLPFVLSLLCPVGLWAASVSQADAERVARHFWNAHHDKGVDDQSAPMSLLDARWDAFFIFESSVADGFVIVAADDRIVPVLAYSFTNRIMADSINPELRWWLDGYQAQVDAWRTSDDKGSAEVAAQWRDYLDGPSNRGPLTLVQPLLTTRWDQDAPYNDLCPVVTQGRTRRAVTGCVATAMAQVLKYWNFPAHGYGQHSYQPEYFGGQSLFGVQHVDFSATVYDWDNMPDQLTAVSTDAEKTAVATLMYHCGVAVDMQYGTSAQGGSGAYVHNVPMLDYSHTLNAVVNYFGYSPSTTAVLRTHVADADWRQLLRDELTMGRPIIYAGGSESEGGHCFVCDGYENLGRFHFNWGWSGMGDGYFTTDNLAPGSGGIGGGNYNFTEGQEVVVGMEPHDEADSLCIIRHFPYAQDFETAPTCWTAAGLIHGSSWWVWDNADPIGFYAAYIKKPEQDNDEHLYSPYIVYAGTYRVSWKARGFSESDPVPYSVAVNGEVVCNAQAFSDWTDEVAYFSVAEGDTVQLDFHYQSESPAPGLTVDNITIEQLASAIDPTAPSSAIRIYPNPTYDRVFVATDDPLLLTELFDLNGRRLAATRAQSIDLTAIPTGIYLIRVATTSTSEMHRVVKR